jgi:hypothetical protein
MCEKCALALTPAHEPHAMLCNNDSVCIHTWSSPTPSITHTVESASNSSSNTSRALARTPRTSPTNSRHAPPPPPPGVNYTAVASGNRRSANSSAAVALDYSSVDDALPEPSAGEGRGGPGGGGGLIDGSNSVEDAEPRVGVSESSNGGGGGASSRSSSSGPVTRLCGCSLPRAHTHAHTQLCRNSTHLHESVASARIVDRMCSM